MRLKVRLLKDEVVETLLYGCVPWSPNPPEYDRRREAHHTIVLLCVGWRKRKCEDHTSSYAHVLDKEDS